MPPDLSSELSKLPPDLSLQFQAIGCAFGALAILAIWKRGGSDNPQRLAADAAYPWFASAIGVWALVAAWALWAKQDVSVDRIRLIRLLASPVNSACFVMALRHFEYSPPIFRAARTDRRATMFVLGVFAVVETLIVGLHLAGYSLEDCSIPDVMFSMVMLFLVGYSFFRSFWKRGFLWLSVVASLSAAIVAVAQLPEVGLDFPPDYWRWSVPMASKLALIVMFMALGITWLWSITPIVPANSLSLRFLAKRSGNRDRPFLVVIAVGGLEHTREMTDVVMKRLLMLAVARKMKGEEGFLHVEVDLRTDAGGLARIGEQLQYPWVEGTFYDIPVPRHYRLLIPPERITIELGLAEIDGELKSILTPLNPQITHKPA